MLGYGLVEFPRSIWMAANIEHQVMTILNVTRK